MSRATLQQNALVVPVLGAALAIACASPTAERQDGPLTAVGCFADVVTDGEHADGYSTQLWDGGGEIVGLLAYHRGLEGDPPVGTLSNVRHDPSTGRLSFTTKLTVGLHSCRIHTNVPSHDVLAFDGTLTKDALRGSVRIEDQLDSPPVPGDFRQTTMRRALDCGIKGFADRESWRRYSEPMLRARGPKW